MNKIGFGELLIIIVIALVVLGPEKLPQAARALGKAIGSVKKYVREASEELDMADIQKIQKDVDGIQKDLLSMGTSIEKTLTDEATKVEKEIENVTKSVNDSVEGEAEKVEKEIKKVTKNVNASIEKTPDEKKETGSADSEPQGEEKASAGNPSSESAAEDPADDPVRSGE